jgi:hypothetical protein
LKKNHIAEETGEVVDENDMTTPPHFRHVCFNIYKRGKYGETLLDLCLQMGSIVHMTIAKKLTEAYPRMASDINVSAEYYGIYKLITEIFLQLANFQMQSNNSFCFVLKTK